MIFNFENTEVCICANATFVQHICEEKRRIVAGPSFLRLLRKIHCYVYHIGCEVCAFIWRQRCHRCASPKSIRNPILMFDKNRDYVHNKCYFLCLCIRKTYSTHSISSNKTTSLPTSVLKVIHCGLERETEAPFVLLST